LAETHSVKFENFSCLNTREKLDEIFVMDKIDYSFEKLKIARRKQLKKKNFSEAMRLKLEG
jgi:hypothetical protein